VRARRPFPPAIRTSASEPSSAFGSVPAAHADSSVGILVQATDTALRVLLVEDREDDAALVVHALRRAGYVLEWRRVDTESAFLAALGDDPQLILTDYSLPHFAGPQAIRLLRERGHDVPCIVISGTIGDDEAVECLRAGADDYLLKDRLGRLGHAVGRSLDEYQQRSHERVIEADLAHQALHDPLTGLPNRSLLRTRLQQAFQAQVAGLPALALLLLDLDHFKNVNDTLGHQAGDILLCQLSERLQDALAPGCFVARLGGDEFAVLLPTGDAARATLVAEHLGRVVQEPFELQGHPLVIDVSIGIVFGPAHAQDADTLLRCADIAMYQAKRAYAGRAIYQPDQDEHSLDRLALLGELRHAIDYDELLLHFQPKLNLRDGTLAGVEALVRWQHPQRGFLPPSEFIPLAEQTGLIHVLSMWVIQAALSQYRALRDAGLDVPVAVNLSRRTLQDPQLPAKVAEMLDSWGVPPAALILEITESSLMADPARAGENLSQLRALGVRISIDDFGTGYSSLASLKNLPVDELKIDQSFVQAMAADASSRAIVRAIIDLADALKLQVVAEGIEDRATLDVLTSLGCDVAQGYFLSRPIAAVELVPWVRNLSSSWLARMDTGNLADVLQERIRGRGARLTAEEEFIARKQAESALQASEERNRLALQAARMGTWSADLTDGVQTWSTETEVLHGLAPGTFEGTFAAFRLTVHPDDWPAFEVEMHSSEHERRDSVAVYRVVWPDGSVHWVENKGRAIFAEDQSLARVIGTSMDVTERQQAELALRASEERNRLALQAAHMGTWDVDLVQGVQSWSVETEALLGMAPGTLDGNLAAFRQAVHPEDWPAIDREWQAAVAERRDFSATYRTVWPDCSVHWLEDNGRALYTPDGAPVRMIGTSMDVTRRKQAEEALQANEERFRKQYKGLPVPTYSFLQVGDDFVLQDYNDAAEASNGGDLLNQLGRSSSAQLGQDQVLLGDLRACVTEQRTIRREMRSRLSDTTQERTLALSFVFVPPQTVMVHIDDVTDRRQAEQQREAMAQSEKLRALGQMASGIAHDLNQSLMLVASYGELAHLALSQAPDDDRLKLAEFEDLVTTMTQAALDGGETVKRLLLFTRAAPKQDTHPVDLSSAVRDAAQLTAPRWRDAAQATGRPISLYVEAQDNPIIQGSSARLRELMTNLIFNAIDALPDGGTIRLRVRVQHGSAVLDVADSGVGMSAEVRERVFEPFFTTKGESGTGLGLAMVFGIVEQHGGLIEVDSAPGEGTTFRITFPLLVLAQAADRPPPRVVQAGSSRPLRVLAVDDEPMMTKAVVRVLRPSGHVVTVAASGEEALDRLAERSFDVVISDMGMGAGMNGWELAEAVKQRWPEVRFLLATGWGAAIDPDEARARGVEAVLAKPYRGSDLLQALHRIDPAA
jgi:diguanylate cyclase (GGDEF)-like protein/PAS domain S-box-containing protein